MLLLWTERKIFPVMFAIVEIFSVTKLVAAVEILYLPVLRQVNKKIHLQRKNGLAAVIANDF